MNYTIDHIARIIDADNKVSQPHIIHHLVLDSRKIQSPDKALFFALKGPRRDGHQFIGELYNSGVRHFVVSKLFEENIYPGAIFLRVYDTLAALQVLAAHHRSQFTIPVIGLTGSNGKTIVKEWLYQLLYEDYDIVRSPKSYNSQVGVPLSVWPMNEHHTLGIFEAGISEQGEMLRLEKMIKPTIGVLTNIGEAHSDGFIDLEHKLREKIILFRNCSVVIGREADFSLVSDALSMLNDSMQVKTWGYGENNDYVVRSTENNRDHTAITIDSGGSSETFSIPFTDDASIENAITCYCVLHHLEIAAANIKVRMQKLHRVNMRLELKKGINGCMLINDRYRSDTNSLEIALSFLDQQIGGLKKTVILSDILHSSLSPQELYEQVNEKISKYKINRVIGIGENISLHLPAILPQGIQQDFFHSTASFAKSFLSSQFKDETILVKGARVFEFEKIVQLLEQKAHQTVLEINLTAIGNNLKQFQKLLKPDVKVMAMVKAFAYGSGGAEIAGILQYHKVDYLGVAYADEGVELRKAGIQLPVMVMNPEENAFEKIVEYNLEPELYSFSVMRSFDKFLKQEGITGYPVHIEIETGMNRLGFAAADMNVVGDEILSTSSFKVRSIFSHLVASEEVVSDSFTKEQYELFEKAANQLQVKLGYRTLRHIANSAAAVRHAYLHMDMVRLGIGLYGIDSSGVGKLSLQTVATLRSTIAQLKQVRSGETVSYNRKGVAVQDSVIATVRLGYADGYPRRLGNGIGKVMIRGQLVPVIGTVCMDMFMADVSTIRGVQEGDEVLVFGENLPLTQIATWADTIPYEIMTGISQRVKRMYYEE